jgi:hypothetical protein
MTASLELLIFVGVQAAGKSSYDGANFASPHLHVSKDLMKNVRDSVVQALPPARPEVG